MTVVIDLNLTAKIISSEGRYFHNTKVNVYMLVTLKGIRTELDVRKIRFN